MYLEDKRTVIGLENAHLNLKKGEGEHGNLLLRMDYYLEDICRVTGVCAQGVDEATALKGPVHIKFDLSLAFE